MRQKYLLLILSFVLTAALSWGDIASQVDPLFAQYSQANVPGASVGIFQNGSILYEQGYGQADVEDSVTAKPITNYRLASLTKQFTAMAILELVNQNKVNLEETLSDIFPGFPAYGKTVKVRHLLNHIGGLIDYESLIPSSQTTQVSDQDVLNMMKAQTGTYFPPGTKYQYSNTGYVMLSNIVELRSGMGFADFVEKNIFAPAGMSESRIYRTEDFQVEERAYGYTQSGSGFDRTDQSVTSATLGDGGVYTSVHDYFSWDQALYTSNLIPLSLLQEAFTSGVLNDGTPVGYGFGWEIGTYKGEVCYSHTGSTIGFRNAVMRFPNKHFTVVVLINRAEGNPSDIASAIADKLLFSH